MSGGVRWVKGATGTVWPVLLEPDDGDGIEFRLRTAAKALTDADCLVLASVVHAYESLTHGYASDERAAEVLTALRQAIRAGGEA